MNKKHLSLLVAALLALGVFAGCTKQEAEAPAEQPATEQPAAEAPAEVTEFQYVTAADIEKAIIDADDSYVLIDARKKADYDEKHIIGTLSADMDSIVSNNDPAPATENMAALLASTDVEGKKIALFCYSGKRYAAAATNVLVQAGIPAENIYTVEGGYKGWTNTDLME